MSASAVPPASLEISEPRRRRLGENILNWWLPQLRDLALRRERPARLIVFLLWLMLAAYLLSRHVMWRDEVRAYSLALTGRTWLDMLHTIHGEGHPATWYLLLRGLHALVPDPHILPAAGFAIGVAAVLLFAFRAPFRWPFIALVLFGRFALYEYSAMARNYGISMLILFAIAALYSRHRDKGWVIGGLLFALCNTNVHSVALAAALLLFWAVDVAAERPRLTARPVRALLVGAVMAAAGALACIATVYPPFNDAAMSPYRAFPVPIAVPMMLPQAGIHLDALLLGDLFAPTTRRVASVILVPPLLFGCLLRWIRNPGALLAAAAAIFGLLLIFTFVYRGYYRHEALIFPFLLTIDWLAAKGRGGRWPGRGFRLPLADLWPRIGSAALLVMLVFQLGLGAVSVARALLAIPESRSYDLAQLLRQPPLRSAIVMGDPDYLIEPLPYYVPNPTWLVRERRFGHYWIIARRTMRPLGLDDLIDAARRLHARTGRPIVILMSERLFRTGQPGERMRKAYGLFHEDWADLARFHAATRQIASFGRVIGSDESYDVFLLREDGK